MLAVRERGVKACDADVLMLARMYGRRLKGYADMGHKILAEARRRLDL